MTAHWRRWTFPALYAAAIVVAVVLRGRVPVVVALYRVTIPWSVFGSGLTSVALSWVVLTLGALLNGAIVWYLGHHLDNRADRSRGAV